MRKSRILKPGAIYHVTARINRKEMLLSANAEKEALLRIISRAKKKYPFSLLSFCIMGNHIHFVIQPKNGISLSRIMQWILSVFAMSWNRRHNMTGHVWGCRFFSRIIEGFHALKNIIEYIDNNPVRVGLADYSFNWKYGASYHRRIGLKYLVDSLPSFSI